MGRDIGPSCKRCRREGVKLLLKGTRCETAKCAMEKQWRSMPPGMHAAASRKSSSYGIRLRETQKVKRFYGVFDRQFQRYMAQAQRAPGNTGEALLALLERRLDNVVCKAGFAPSRKAARVGITHGHFRLNGRRVDKPGILVNVGDKIEIKPKPGTEKWVRANLELRTAPLQPWLSVDIQKLLCTISALPGRDDVQIPVEEQLIVEFASR